MFKQLLIIGIGGALGSILRFLSQQVIGHWHTLIFPLGTFVVNIIGCFLIGIFYGLLEKYTLLNKEWGLFLITGLCGGFTTFSSFSYESLSLLREGNYVYFLIYVSASIILGIAAVLVGMLLMK